MSIIYDALKKVQGELKIKNTPASDTEKETITEKKTPAAINPVILYPIVLILGFLFTGVVYHFLIPSLKTEGKASVLAKKTEPADKKTGKEKSQAKTASPSKPISPPASKVIVPPVNTPAVAATPKPVQENILNAPIIEQKKEPPVENEPLPTLTLNGIFFTGKIGYALINNRIVREGDRISGLVVKKIKTDLVELGGNNSRVTVLRNPR